MLFLTRPPLTKNCITWYTQNSRPHLTLRLAASSPSSVVGGVSCASFKRALDAQSPWWASAAVASSLCGKGSRPGGARGRLGQGELRSSTSFPPSSANDWRPSSVKAELGVRPKTWIQLRSRMSVSLCMPGSLAHGCLGLTSCAPRIQLSLARAQRAQSYSNRWFEGLVRLMYTLFIQ